MWGVSQVAGWDGIIGGYCQARWPWRPVLGKRGTDAFFNPYYTILLQPQVSPRQLSLAWFLVSHCFSSLCMGSEVSQGVVWPHLTSAFHTCRISCFGLGRVSVMFRQGSHWVPEWKLCQRTRRASFGSVYSADCWPHCLTDTAHGGDRAGNTVWSVPLGDTPGRHFQPHVEYYADSSRFLASCSLGTIPSSLLSISPKILCKLRYSSWHSSPLLGTRDRTPLRVRMSSSLPEMISQLCSCLRKTGCLCYVELYPTAGTNTKHH